MTLSPLLLPKKWCFDGLMWRKDAIILTMLQIGNILCWYYTNGMNGIAMESYAKEVKRSGGNGFTSMVATTCFVTAVQLLTGAVIGRVVLLVLNSKISWRQIVSTHWSPLSFLHACGSLATNLGFMYGKASVVQVFKLLEPFETLLLSQVFFRQEGKCSFNIVASMTMVIAGAVSLLQIMKKESKSSALTQAIVAALASGLLLSCRNVLQRKHQCQHLEKQPPQAANFANSLVLPDKHNDAPAKSFSELEKSLLQFTQLSLFSGIFVVVCGVVPWLLFFATDNTKASAYPIDYQILIWHPLYNIFSMITLGFCSALTHSLLNAGKRVFAICMSMIWFQERSLEDPMTCIGLGAVALGGIWYSIAMKGSKASSVAPILKDNGAGGGGDGDSPRRRTINYRSLVVIRFIFAASVVASLLSVTLWQLHIVTVSDNQRESVASAHHSTLDLLFNKENNTGANARKPSPEHLFASHKQVHHSVVTPFMIGQSKQSSLARARMELFKTFCYPTMYHQTSQNFHWIILVDSELEKSIMDEMVSLLNDFPSKKAFLIATDKPELAHDSIGLQTVARMFRDGMIDILTGDTHKLLNVLKWRERQEPVIVLETLLDADDGLHKRAIEALQSAASNNLSNQVHAWQSKATNETVPVLLLRDTWWVHCGNNHLEWQNRDIFRVHKNVYEAQGLQSGVLAMHKTPNKCISAGYTRAGYTSDFLEQNENRFPKETSYDKLKSASLPECSDNYPLRLSRCHLRFPFDFPFAVTSSTITSQSMTNVDPWVGGFTKNATVKQDLWSLLARDFFIDRYQTYNISVSLYLERESILNEKQKQPCSSGFPCFFDAKDRVRKLKNAILGIKQFRVVPPESITLHDVDDPPIKKRHQCIEAIRDRQMRLVGDLIQSSIDGYESERWEKALLVNPAYHSNVGDHMITLGEIAFARRFGLTDKFDLLQCGEAGQNLLPNCQEQDFWLDEQFQANGKPVLFHGGGNWGDIWPVPNTDRLATLENMMSKNFTFVCMPQSLYYGDDSKKKLDATRIEAALSVSKTNSVHQATFLWREQYSFEQATELYPSANNILFPDIAFQLGPFSPRQVSRLDPLAVDIVVFMRLDKESLQKTNRNKNAVRSKLTTVLGAEKAQNLTFRIVDWPDQLKISRSNDFLFSEWSIRLLSMGRVLICDRLHASILAYISGIPFVYIDQMTGKISKTLGVSLNSGLEGCSDGHTSDWAQASNLTEALKMAVNYLETKSFGEQKQRLLPNGTMVPITPL